MGICSSIRNKDDGGRPQKKNEQNHGVQNRILRQRGNDFNEKYIQLDVLGQGAMGQVARIQLRDAQEPMESSKRRKHKPDYALKQILLDRVDPDQPKEALEGLKNEIAILQDMDHPNILKAHEVYINDQQIYLVLELCDGGDLYSRMPYTEKQAANIISKLCSAVKYMHDHAIVHRDLKLQNIMFESQDENAEIKVIDFGLSKKFGDHKLDVIYGGVGSLSTMAPQVINNKYTSQADLWAVGVITFMLLSTLRPFYDKHPKLFIQKILEAKYNFTSQRWDRISKEAKDFISKLLVISEEKRMTAQKALKHRWLSKQFKLQDRQADDRSTAELAKDSLMHYKNTCLLKKIALNVIAHKSSTREILNLRKIFDQYDTANDGVISFQEFKNALRSSNYPKDLIAEIFHSIDVNMNGRLNYTEFIAATLETHGHLEEERIREAFDRLDTDSSGFISRSDLAAFLGENTSDEQITTLLQCVDQKEDTEQISWEEFLTLFRKDRTTLLVSETKKSQTLISGHNSMGSPEDSLDDTFLKKIKNPFVRAVYSALDVF